MMYGHLHFFTTLRFVATGDLGKHLNRNKPASWKEKEIAPFLLSGQQERSVVSIHYSLEYNAIYETMVTQKKSQQPPVTGTHTTNERRY